MAEKNTHSILETIKKKLHKFDQKSEKNSKISEVVDEFEYIAPAKKDNAAAATEVKTEIKSEEKLETKIAEKTSEKSMPNFEDSLGLDDSIQSAAAPAAKDEAPQTQPAATENKLDDFNLDDLDLDDESAAKKPSPVAPEINAIPAVEAAPTPASQPNSEDPLGLETNQLSLSNTAPTQTESAPKTEENREEFVEEDLEDYEGEVDFAEEEYASDSNAEVVAEEHHELPEDDILSFPEDEDAEVESTAEKPEVNSFEEETHPDLQVATTTPTTEKPMEDFNFDDLQKNQIKSEPTKTEVSSTNEKDEDEFDLDALEKQIEEKRKQDSEKKSAQSSTIHQEIDLEFEKELMGFKPSTPRDQQNSGPAPEPLLPIINKKPEELLFTKEESKSVQQMPAQPVSAKEDTTLMNQETVMQTTQSIKKLIDAKNVVAGISSFSQSPALQDLATQLMEPKLEKWLNENLAQVVEKIVREEIKKIIPTE